MKQKCAKENHMDRCIRNQRMGINVLESKAPGSTSRQGSREDSGKESVPYISGKGDAKL
jgi:hypothetical protein